ncbi:HAD hydrolase-like protein [Bacillaceae bacterium]
MFKTILFDVDGVFLSEERYFDASALTVWEMVNSPLYLGLDPGQFSPCPPEETIRRVRALIFDEDRVLNFIKSRGINANWDMVYLAFSYQLVRLLAEIHKQDPLFVADVLREQIDREAVKKIGEKARQTAFVPDFAAFTADFAKSRAEKQALLLYLNDLAEEKTGIKTEIFSRRSALWDVCQETFQEWYLGDEKVELSIGKPPVQAGKRGFLHDEIPIAPPEKMADVLRRLRAKGIVLGIGTGRPTIETVEPLKAMGLLEYFAEDRVVTASDVLAAERKYPERAPLAKPQPYCYVQGFLGKRTPVEKALAFPLPIANGDEVLIVGDSVADYMAAKSIGCRFAATLTGLSGKEARAKFEELHADYILDDVTEILEIFGDEQE